MIQAIGLTGPRRRRHQSPIVDDLTFEAPGGRITALLGPQGAGKTAALRLLLQLDAGRGVVLLHGRPVHQLPNPARELGVMLGGKPGDPSRSARGHLRMLAGAAGVSSERADDVLELVGLSGFGHHRLSTFSLGMERRIDVAASLLGDPDTLVLDEPFRGLSPREVGWLRCLLREYADQGGAVLITSRHPAEAVRTADRVLTLDHGRLVADQDAADYARTRLRPRVAVTSPHADRLARLLAAEAGTVPRPCLPGGATDLPQVVHDGGTRLSVYGSTCAAVGESAFRNGILVHRLAEEVGDTGVRALSSRSRANGSDVGSPIVSVAQAPSEPSDGTAPKVELHRAPHAAPIAPLRYEVYRLFGVRTTLYVMAGAALFALFVAITLAAVGGAATDAIESLSLLSGWPLSSTLVLPPAALAAGVLGSRAYTQEYSCLSLATVAVPPWRHPRLLVAKLLVLAACGSGLAIASALMNIAVIALLFGTGFVVPVDAVALAGHVLGFVAVAVGSAWTGAVTAGVLRSWWAGLTAVVVAPVLVVVTVQEMLTGPSGEALDGFSGRLETTYLPSWPVTLARWGMSGAQLLLSSPAVGAVVLSALVLVCGYPLHRLYKWARCRGGSAAESQNRSNVTL